MNEITRKYKINEYLDKLTVREYRIAIKLIPKLLDISVNTFHNYRKIGVNDEQDVPYQKIKMLEILFDINAGALENDHIQGKSLKTLIKEQ